MGRPVRRLALVVLLLLCASLVWAQDKDKDLVRTCAPFTPGPTTPARLVAQDGSRQALVVGVSQYQAPEIPDLVNPPTDAARVAEALWRTGFEVRVCRDLGLAALKGAVDEFLVRREKAAVSVFYYSGHGGEWWDENFLYPADVRRPTAGFANLDQVREVALSVGRLSDAERKNPTRTDVLILDACRTDPFSKGGGGGLGELDATQGLVVAYSTQARKVADDSDVFSTALAQSWVTPGLGVLDVLNEAKNLAYTRMSGRQQPFLSIGPGVRNQALVPAAEPTESARVVSLPLGKVGDPAIGGPTGRVTTALEGRPESMRFVELSAGVFTMGRPKYDGTGAGQRPQHRVRLVVPFFIGETEVTQGQWAAVLQEALLRQWPEAVKLKELSFRFTGAPELPADTVNWCDAIRFANALSRMEGFDPVYEVSETCEQGEQVWLRAATHPGFRLPLEAEWEYATRAGDEGIWWSRDEEAGLCTRANVLDETYRDLMSQRSIPTEEFAPCSDGFTGTAPVRHFSPNPWGLYDTIGNVSEWMEDVWVPYEYDKRKAGVEFDSRTATMRLSGDDGLPVPVIFGEPDAPHIYRGGSWADLPIGDRIGHKISSGRGSFWGTNGFRLVLASAPSP